MAVKIRRKSFRQQIKEPDEFISLTQKTILYARENTRSLAIGTAVVLAVITLVGVFFKMSIDRKDEFANKMYEEIQLANNNYNQGKFDEAAKLFDGVLSKTDKTGLFNEFALVGLGYAYMGSKQYGKSIKIFEGLVLREDIKYPKEELYKSLAIIYKDTGNKSKGIEVYKKLIELFPLSRAITDYKDKLAEYGEK